MSGAGNRYDVTEEYTVSYVVNSACSGLHSNCCIVSELLVKLKILEKK